MKKFLGTITTIAVMGILLSATNADEKKGKKAKQGNAKTETVVSGLNNPCGVAIQPETGVVFVSDSGAGRVVRVVDGKSEDVITGFPKDVYGKGPKYDIGPLGLVFLDKDTLVVGGGGNVDDKELFRVYKVPQAGKSIKADDMCGSATLPANANLKAEGNYYGVAAAGNAVYVTCNGDDTKGWVAKAEVSDSGVKFKRYIATKEATEVDAPVAVAVSPKGQIVIGQMGEITVPEDGLLTFYNAKNGKMQRNFEVGLSDITGVAFNPKKKNQIYATDFAWHDTSQGGLFRLVPKKDGDTQTVEAKKVVGLDKPTALAFDKDGALYITVIGDGDGKLLKISSGL